MQRMESCIDRLTTTRATGSVSVRVQKEDVYSHLDLEFWTYTIANGDYTDNFLFTDVNTSVWALVETLATGYVDGDSDES